MKIYYWIFIVNCLLCRGDYLLSVNSELNTEDLKSTVKLLFDGTSDRYLQTLKLNILTDVSISVASGSWVGFMSQHFYTIRQILLKYDKMSHHLYSIDIECIFKCESPVTPEEYALLLKKVELQLEKVPKILEQQKQLDNSSDLYKLAKEILSSEFCKTDYEIYKNKVEEFEQKFEEFNKNQDLKNDDNKLDDEKELHEDEIGNDNDGGTCNCLKNILWYRVFLCLSLLSLLLLIISVYCLIVTAIFLLASLVLYFIQKTKKDNDNMEVMADNLLSSEINQEQSKNLISIDKDHSKNVKQQNEFSLFERANN